VRAGQFSFEQVPFSHPLWILFSSGTTGMPKAIVHSHGGILIEQLKLQHLHLDLRQGDRMFFFTTTGWMMWNFLVSSLLIGVRPVLYDGSPTYPDAGVLWQLAQDCGVTFFGTSPSYVDLMSRAGIVPARTYDLSSLRAVMPAGSPVSPECTAWFYPTIDETRLRRDEYFTGVANAPPGMPMGGAGERTPRFGIMRNVSVGDSDRDARERMVEAMTVFYDQFTALWRRHGDGRFTEPYDFARAIEDGRVIAGSADTVRAQLSRMLRASGCNHFAGAFAFGSLSYAEARSSLMRFGEQVAPALRGLDRS
jgi:acyl-CoA synthetase (AMP-forming)/AMP-acid ligase II